MNRWVAVLVLIIAVGVIAIFVMRRDYVRETASPAERAAPAESAAPASSAALETAAEPEAPPSEPPPATAPLSDDRAEQANRSKIVGGTIAPDGRYPWIAAVGQRHGDKVASYCAATLIAPQWILTAAHCRVPDGDFAVLGRLDLATSRGSIVRITQMLRHPEYDPDTLDNDFALGHLETAQSIAPIALVSADEKEIRRAGGHLWIAGWGQLGELNYSRPNILQHAPVRASSQEHCVETYDDIGRVVTGNMFCADGVPAQGGITDACKGDSGGPIVAFHPINQRAALAGVISKGQGCARPGIPGVYARLSKLRSWVLTCMDDPEHTSCRPPS